MTVLATVAGQAAASDGNPGAPSLSGQLRPNLAKWGPFHKAAPLSPCNLSESTALRRGLSANEPR